MVWYGVVWNGSYRVYCVVFISFFAVLFSFAFLSFTSPFPRLYLTWSHGVGLVISARNMARESPAASQWQLTASTSISEYSRAGR